MSSCSTIEWSSGQVERDAGEDLEAVRGEELDELALDVGHVGRGDRDAAGADVPERGDHRGAGRGGGKAGLRGDALRDVRVAAEAAHERDGRAEVADDVGRLADGQPPRGLLDVAVLGEPDPELDRVLAGRRGGRCGDELDAGRHVGPEVVDERGGVVLDPGVVREHGPDDRRVLAHGRHLVVCSCWSP